jgi:hypothetical protein
MSSTVWFPLPVTVSQVEASQLRWSGISLHAHGPSQKLASWLPSPLSREPAPKRSRSIIVGSGSRDYACLNVGMPSTLQAQHLEDAVSVYGSLSPGVPSTASAYPDFSAPIQHEEATISHVTGIPDFHHGHNNGQEHSVNRQSLLAHGHLEVGISQAPGQTNLAYRANAPHLSSQQPALGSSMEDVPATAATGGFDMLPPPPGTHPTWQALHDFAQLHAAAHGYALSINTTAKNRSRIKLACVCYGAPKNTHKLTPETRVRKNRASYKTGCKMWIEGKKQEDGTWLLRVGEPLHNHPGRSADGWAVQRKRTWGVQGGRVGMGGVTAKEERERLGSVDEGGSWQNSEDQAVTAPTPTQGPSHSLESGGLVWRIVEQEMLRNTWSGPRQGRRPDSEDT